MSDQVIEVLCVDCNTNATVTQKDGVISVVTCKCLQ